MIPKPYFLDSTPRTAPKVEKNICLHPFENLERVISTCNYIDADFVYCKKCESYLYGNFKAHDRDYPDVILDEKWMKSPDGFTGKTREGAEKINSLTTREIPWEYEIQHMLPVYPVNSVKIYSQKPSPKPGMGMVKFIPIIVLFGIYFYIGDSIVLLGGGFFVVCFYLAMCAFD